MNKNEIDFYIKKYIADDDHRKILSIENSLFDYDSLIYKLILSKRSDCPDAYYIDENLRIIYIFEHFEVDNSKHSKKGSSVKENQANDIRTFKKTVDEQSSKKETIEYKSFIKNDVSLKYYFETLVKSFKKHISSIENYKNNLFGILKIDKSQQKEWKFITTFIIEDTSLFGNICYDKEPLVPIFIKEFMDIFRGQTSVDCLFCSTFFNIDFLTYVVSKEDQDKFINEEKELLKIKIVEFKSIETFGMSFKIDKK